MGSSSVLLLIRLSSMGYVSPAIKISVNDIINFTLRENKTKRLCGGMHMELKPISTVLEELRSSLDELRESL